MNFSERLEEYRKSLNLLKREFATKLEISESYYNLLANNKREPSKKILTKLVSISERPEEYWLYGIDTTEYRNTREITKATNLAIENIIEMNLIKNFGTLFQGDETNKIAEDLLIAALKADLSYFFQK